MKMENEGLLFKAVAVDLDGTLLNDQQKITKESEGFLIQYQEEDGELILITGRNYEDSIVFAKQLKMLDFHKGYLVYDDGQSVIDFSGDRRLYRAPYINKEDMVSICKRARESRNNLFIYCENTIKFVITHQVVFNMCILKLKRLIAKYLWKEKNSSKLIPYRNITRLENEGIVKISILPRLGRKIEDNYSCYSSLLNNKCYYVINEGVLEIKNAEANKLRALKRIMSWRHWKEIDIIYFGNGGNDIDSLTYFTQAYVMDNAPDYVKKAAHNLAGSNNYDGVVCILKKLLGEEQKWGVLP